MPPRARKPAGPPPTTQRTVRPADRSDAPTIVTIGYEQRDGDEAADLLAAAGVSYLADIRQRPFSRKPDFRAKALAGYCARVGIECVGWPILGSTKPQRDEVHETGNYEKFHADFRKHCEEFGAQALDDLAAIAQRRRIALLCYERAHHQCHRQEVADLLAERTGAAIIAIE